MINIQCQRHAALEVDISQEPSLEIRSAIFAFIQWTFTSTVAGQTPFSEKQREIKITCR